MAWVKLSCTCLPPQTCLSVLPEVFMWHPKSLSVQIVAIHLPGCSLLGLFYRRASSERLHLSVKLSFVNLSTLHLLKGGSALFLSSSDIYGLFPLTAHSSQVGVSGSEPVKVEKLGDNDQYNALWEWAGLRTSALSCLSSTRLSICLSVCPGPRGSVPVKAEPCSYTAWAPQPTQHHLTAHNLHNRTHTYVRRHTGTLTKQCQ